MEGSIFANKKLQFVIKLLTALAFTILTLYQVVLLFAIDSARFGRSLGITCYIVITIACYLALGQKKKVQTASSVILVIGLFMLFLIKLINVPGLFGVLNFSVPTSVLNCSVYILSQMGAVLLAVFNLTLRHDRDTAAKRRAVVILMSIVIAMFLACFIMESILLIKYRVNIDLSLKVTFATRLIYFCGFTGLAVRFMLPEPKAEEEAKSGEFVYSEDVEDEIDLIM